MSDEEGSRRGQSIPRLDIETERPPAGGDGADAYSAATVVRSLPDDLLLQMAALKQQKLPKIEGAPRVEEDAEIVDAQKGDASVETTASADDSPASSKVAEAADGGDNRAVQAPEPGADATAEVPDDESSERPPPPRKGTRGSQATIDPATAEAPPRSGSSTTIVALLVAAVGVAVAIYFATR